MYESGGARNEGNLGGLELNLLYPLRFFADLGLKINDLSKEGFLRTCDYFLELLVEGFDDFKLYEGSHTIDGKFRPSENAPKVDDPKLMDIDASMDRDVALRMYKVDIRTAKERKGNLFLTPLNNKKINIKNGSYKGNDSVFISPFEINGRRYVVDFQFKFVPTYTTYESVPTGSTFYEWTLHDIKRFDITERDDFVKMLEIRFPKDKYFSVPRNSPRIELLDDIYHQKISERDAIAMLEGIATSKN